jgi:hypothetical protein
MQCHTFAPTSVSNSSKRTQTNDWKELRNLNRSDLIANTSPTTIKSIRRQTCNGTTTRHLHSLLPQQLIQLQRNRRETTLSVTCPSYLNRSSLNQQFNNCAKEEVLQATRLANPSIALPVQLPKNDRVGHAIQKVNMLRIEPVSTCIELKDQQIKYKDIANRPDAEKWRHESVLHTRPRA